MDEEMKYTESHEWIKLNDQVGIVGITDFAQKELGDIVYVELPEVGKKVGKGEEAVVLESTKAAADVYSPVAGEIVEVNEALSDRSELVNSSPENEGWLFKIKVDDESALDSLMNEEAYQNFLE